MSLPALRVRQPSSWEELFDLLDGDPGWTLYMGGTDLLPRMHARQLRPSGLVDLKRLPGMGRVAEVDQHVELGAAVTYHHAARSEVLASRLPVLAGLMGEVGNVRVRTAGTLGGSLAAAVQASDPATLLLALDAEVVLRSRDGRRALPLEGFLLGTRRTALRAGEVLEALRVPRPAPTTRVAFQRLSVLHGPLVNAAVVHDEGRTRLVVGAVSERPRRLAAAEELARRPDGAAAAARAAAAEVVVADGSPLGETYLRRVVGTLVERLVSESHADDAGRVAR